MWNHYAGYSFVSVYGSIVWNLNAFHVPVATSIETC